MGSSRQGLAQDWPSVRICWMNSWIRPSVRNPLIHERDVISLLRKSWLSGTICFSCVAPTPVPETRAEVGDAKLSSQWSRRLSSWGGYRTGYFSADVLAREVRLQRRRLNKRGKKWLGWNEVSALAVRAPRWAAVSPGAPPAHRPACEALDCNRLSDHCSYSAASWGQKEVCARPQRGHAEEVTMNPILCACVCVCVPIISSLLFEAALFFGDLRPCHCSVLPCFVLPLPPFLLRRPVIGCGFFPQNRALQRLLWWLTFPPPCSHQPAAPSPSKRVRLFSFSWLQSSVGKACTQLRQHVSWWWTLFLPIVWGDFSCLRPPFKKWTVVLSFCTFIKMKWCFSLALPRISGSSVLLLSPSIRDCDRDQKVAVDPFGD